MTLPEPFYAWCESHLGPFQVLADCSHPHGESRVWRLKAEKDQGQYFLKAHRRAGKWEREVFAYERWLPTLGDFVPRLVAIHEGESNAILIAALPGVVMESLTLSPEQERACWQQAGAVTARLHQITNSWFGSPFRDGTPQTVAEPSAVRFWEDRIASWIDRAEAGNHLNPEEIAFARAGLAAINVLEGETAVAVQHDYTPRNWIVVPETGAWSGVIDFEHACWDIRAAEFKRFYDGEFVGRPDLEEAFFTGYGALPDARLRAQIQLMRLHNAVSSVVWAVEHNDTNFATRSHTALRRLMGTSL